jgi:hypothetical protein
MPRFYFFDKSFSLLWRFYDFLLFFEQPSLESLDDDTKYFYFFPTPPSKRCRVLRVKNYSKNSIIQWFPYSTFAVLHAWVNPYTSLKYLFRGNFSFFGKIPTVKNLFFSLLAFIYVSHPPTPNHNSSIWVWGKTRRD